MDGWMNNIPTKINQIMVSENPDLNLEAKNWDFCFIMNGKPSDFGAKLCKTFDLERNHSA